ncbi:serine/threonine-protein kinase [Streptomyces sp. NPDC060031]|uniref:serine/threonine-protein kinase n=1 Tax=Streptomyces sp. NPDC060031 TaxID=3347043 RepID=UPI00367BD594
MWDQGTVLGERYTLVERLGRGAMGEVWRARDGVLEREVAVKILLPALLDDATFAARFRREAKILAALNHPGIVDVHDYGEGETAYIVMELIDGRPLEDVRADRGPLPVAEALDIAAQALDALHVAHRRGIVHRDVKPSNLMLRPDGRVTVTDFGIARSTGSTRLTASHAVLGTALYTAPEQAEGIAAVPASDLYSLGVVCYELLTGEVPFPGSSVLEVVLKHIREPAPDLPSAFPEAVRAFVARALAKQPEDRYPDAAVMAAAARRAAAGEQEPAPAPVPPPIPAPAPAPAPAPPTAAAAAPRARRGRTIALFVPVVVVVGVGTTLYIDRGADQHDAKAPGPGPVVSMAAPGGSASPGGGASAAASPGAVPGSAPSPDGANGSQSPGSGTGPGTGPAQGNVGGAAAAGGSGGTPATGGSGGSGNKPAPPPASQGSAVPQGCGGADWGAITNVSDGLKIGLVADSPDGGTKVIMGGHTEFGWVKTKPQWTKFNACSLSGPRLGQSLQSSSSPRLIPTSGAADTSWKLVEAPTPGAYYIKNYSGQTCLTHVGAGKELAITTCTPDNKFQQWYVP